MNLSQIVSKNSPALVLVNPEAGGGRAADFVPRIEKFFATQTFPARFVQTASIEDLESQAREGSMNGHRLLVGMGGDGTFQALANAAVGTGAVLGVLPAGGGNDFAAAAGMPKDLVAAAHALLRGKPRAMDLLRARTADGKARLFAGGGGIGLDAETARYANGMFRRLAGTLRYVSAALCALRKFSPLEVTVEFPDGEQPAATSLALLAGVLNTPTYGAGLRFAPQAQPDDGWLDVVLVGRLTVFELLEVLPRLARGGDLGIAQIKRLRARRVRLSANRPAAFHGDGEILGLAPVEIEVVPGAVQILAPEFRGLR